MNFDVGYPEEKIQVGFIKIGSFLESYVEVY